MSPEISETTVVPSLTRWGASPPADLVYRTLAMYGPGSIATIGSILELKPRQVHAAMDELYDLGVVTCGPNTKAAPHRRDERVWHGSPPTEVIATLRQRQIDLVRDRQRMVNALRQMSVSDLALAKGGLARALYGVDQVRARLAELVYAEQHEHMAMNPESKFTVAAVQASMAASWNRIGGDVNILTLGVPASEVDAYGLPVEHPPSPDTEYRELPQLPIKLIIMDRSTAVIPLDPSDSSKGAWEITAPDAVEELVAFYLRYWNHAQAQNRSWKPPRSLGPRDQTIASMLAAGYTDAIISMRLGLSARTIAYAVGSLLDQYHLTSRFQLGLTLGALAAT